MDQAMEDWAVLMLLIVTVFAILAMIADKVYPRMMLWIVGKGKGKFDVTLRPTADGKKKKETRDESIDR